MSAKTCQAPISTFHLPAETLTDLRRKWTFFLVTPHFEKTPIRKMVCEQGKCHCEEGNTMTMFVPDQLTPRTYAFTRLRAGDYLLVSNDGELIYRVHSYTDGKIHGLDADYEARTFWRIAHMTMADFTAIQGWYDCSDPYAERWVEDDYFLDSRKAALAVVGLC